MRGSETNRRPPPWIGDGPCGRGTTPVHHRLATAALRLVADSVARRRDVSRGNGGQTGDSYWAVSDGLREVDALENATAPAHAGAVGIAAQRSCSNGLPAPPSHQSRLAEPAGGRLLVLVIAIGPCAGEEEQKTTTNCGGGCSHRSSCGLLSRRNWHQACYRWLPGFKGPIPSTTLDERRATFTC